MTQDEFIRTIDKFSAASGLKPSTICQYAIANRHFYDRVKGGYFHVGTAQKVLAFLAERPEWDTIHNGISPAPIKEAS